MASIDVTHFTDPTCPFAYSAEPQRWRLKWRFGDQLAWTTRMVLLADSRDVQVRKGFTPAMLQAGYEALEASHGMPFDLSPRAAVPASQPACREFVAVREHAGEDEAEALLRQLRFQQMAHPQMLDELHPLREASHAAGIDSHDLDHWGADPATLQALDADAKAARDPLPAALAQSERLASWDGGMRYTCPSLELRTGDVVFAVPGFQDAKAYDVAFANLDPDLEIRPPAEDPLEVLRWAGTPLATAEVAAVMGRSRDDARAALTDAGATEHPLGTDALWSA